ECDERLPSLRLHVGRVDDGQASTRQAPRGDVVQRGKGVIRRGLVVLLIGHERTEPGRREHFRGLEVLPSERRLAAARWSDQDDQRELGNRERHRVKTAICVGGPTCGSSSPTGRNRAAYPTRARRCA